MVAAGTREPDDSRAESPGNNRGFVLVVACMAVLVVAALSLDVREKRATNEAIVAKTVEASGGLDTVRIRSETVRTSDGACTVVTQTYQRSAPDKFYFEPPKIETRPCT